MRVEDRKIGREGTNLGGEGLVVAIGAFMDRGCFRSSDLVVEGCWDSEEVIAKHWFSCFPVRFWIRKHQWPCMAVPRVHRHERQLDAGVSIEAVAGAVNRLHVGY